MKLSFLLILIVAALLLSTASETLKAQQNPSKTEIHESKTDQHPDQGTQKTKNAEKPPAPTKPPLALDEIPSQKTQANPRQEQQGTIEKWFNPTTIPNWAIVLVTLIYVCVSIGQFVAIRRQAKFARRTLRAINRQADIAVEGVVETRKAAEAAKKSANVAEASLTVVERAWLAVLFHQPFQPKAGAHNPIYYFVKNTGHTVAFLKERKLNALPWKGCIPERELAPKPTGVLPTIAAIFPGDKFPLEGLVDIDFTQQMINDAATGQFIFDVYGYVAYDDTFGIRHITRFCQAYNPNGDSGSFTYPREAQAGYNDAD